MKVSQTGIIVLVVILTVMSVFLCGKAEDEVEAYILCMPKDRVNIRMGPSRSACSIGWCEVGDVVYPDGKVKNGFMHCVGLGVEAGEGWIHKGYIVDEKPEYVNCSATIISRARLAARKNVNGKRSRWLKSGASLKVYYWTDSWCLTNCGYVQSQYLELNGV